MERDIDRVYRTVNEAWGRERDQLPPITLQEAQGAVKRLWRLATGKTVTPKTTFKATSGNRYNRIRVAGGICVLNLDAGWWGLVHSISHRAHHRLHPGKRPHDPTQAYLERRLIEHVVGSGWLDGRLKKPAKEKTKPDLKAVRHARVLARIKVWDAKRKRAETALKKLRRQKAYYEKNGAPWPESNRLPAHYEGAALPMS